MYDADLRQPTRLWSLAIYSFYVVAIVPGSFLAYIGIGWMDAYERGWRTQVAAAALAAAWIPLALGVAFCWKAVRAGSRPIFLHGVGFVLLTVGFYAVPLVWGGHMLI